METRSRKRKQRTSPPNPYERTYIQRSHTPIKRDRTRITPLNRNLRARRVFSPASISDAKGAETSEKEVHFDVGFDPKVEIGSKEAKFDVRVSQEEKLDLGVGENIKEVEFDGGVSQKDLKERKLDLGVSENTGVDDKEVEIDVGVPQNDNEIETGKLLVQTTPQNGDIDGEKVLKGEAVIEKDGCASDAEKDGQKKAKVKPGVIAPCSGRKLFKNPSSFNYRRLLPYLMDLGKDSSNVLETHPHQKIDKSAEEMPPTSLSASQNILIDGSSKVNLIDGHFFGGSNTCTGSSSTELLNMGSYVQPLTDSTALKTPEISILSQVNNSAINEPPHSYDGTVSRPLTDVPGRAGKSQDATCFAHEASPPVKLLCSFVISESSSVKEGGEFDKGGQKDNEDTDARSYTGDELQSTPPDGDLFCTQRPTTSQDDVLRSLNNIIVSDNNGRGAGGERERHTDSKPKLGIVLAPCSRKKLYKSPGSFSYRRLLPYLMDLAKNDTNTLEPRPCLKAVKTVDKHSSFVTSQDVPRAGPNKEVRTDDRSYGGSDASLNPDLTGASSPTGSSKVENSNLESTVSALVELTMQDPIVEFPIQEPPETSIVSKSNGSMIAKPFHMNAESALQVQQDMLNKSINVEVTHNAACIGHETILQTDSSFSIVIPKPSLEEAATRGSSLSLEEALCSIRVQECTIDANSHGVLSLNQEPSNPEPLTPSEKYVSGHSTGILKRTPRGCRGICNCLSCASFGLHADRAFEFARNQMLDAEEVATGLMKELSDVRALLEKSIDGAESHAIIHISQVKEACLKTLRAEEFAKDYLKQMNQEVDIHVRTPCLQRPRVRFANNLQYDACK